MLETESFKLKYSTEMLLALHALDVCGTYNRCKELDIDVNPQLGAAIEELGECIPHNMYSKNIVESE